MSAFLSLLSLRRLLAALSAVALLWAPLALQSGSAMGMAPSDHHEQMMKSGDCHEKQSDQDDPSTTQLCCTAMCTAIVAPPLPSLETAPVLSTSTGTVLAESGPSYLAEMPTPPPRLS